MVADSGELFAAGFSAGASAGFGMTITRRMVADGHRVIATARRADKLAELVAELGDRVLALIAEFYLALADRLLREGRRDDADGREPA